MFGLKVPTYLVNHQLTIVEDVKIQGSVFPIELDAHYEGFILGDEFFYSRDS